LALTSFVAFASSALALSLNSRRRIFPAALFNALIAESRDQMRSPFGYDISDYHTSTQEFMFRDFALNPDSNFLRKCCLLGNGIDF
jgi:hypothetical protein